MWNWSLQNVKALFSSAQEKKATNLFKLYGNWKLTSVWKTATNHRQHSLPITDFQQPFCWLSSLSCVVVFSNLLIVTSVDVKKRFSNWIVITLLCQARSPKLGIFFGICFLIKFERGQKWFCSKSPKYPWKWLKDFGCLLTWLDSVLL